MFAMQQHQYVYAAAPAAPRQYAAHGTSSAFSSSANPDEDWTKISDLAERRRIQNRIAQRNYRKKLKRRLEDLERRAGTSDGASSASSPPSGVEKSASKSTKKSSTPKKSASQPVVQQVVLPPKPMTTSQFTPPMHPEDDLLFAPSYDGRERSHTPPMFAYSTYPPPEDLMLAPYSSNVSQQYRPMTTEAAYADWNTAAAAVPVSQPPMTHFSDALRADGFAEDSMMPYMSYGFTANPYDHNSNPTTPPLSHSFDHSANCSDAGYDYPTTPLSMPGSPNLLQH